MVHVSEDHSVFETRLVIVHGRSPRVYHSSRYSAISSSFLRREQVIDIVIEPASVYFVCMFPNLSIKKTSSIVYQEFEKWTSVLACGLHKHKRLSIASVGVWIGS